MEPEDPGVYGDVGVVQQTPQVTEYFQHDDCGPDDCGPSLLTTKTRQQLTATLSSRQAPLPQFPNVEFV